MGHPNISMSSGSGQFYPNRAKGKQFQVDKVARPSLGPYIPSTIPGDVYISAEKRENLDRSVKLAQGITDKPFIGSDPGIKKTNNTKNPVQENVFSVPKYIPEPYRDPVVSGSMKVPPGTKPGSERRAMVFSRLPKGNAGYPGRTVSQQDEAYMPTNYTSGERRRQELMLPQPLRGGMRPEPGDVRPFLSPDVQPRVFDPCIYEPTGYELRMQAMNKFTGQGQGFTRSAKSILASTLVPWKSGYRDVPSDKNKGFGDAPLPSYYPTTYKPKFSAVHSSSKVFQPNSTVPTSSAQLPSRSIQFRHRGADVI